jgi:nucleoside-diphosphate-sugar epimerase
MRVVVTGASGHVGRALARALSVHGFAVVGISRHLNLAETGMEWLAADISDWASMQQAVEKLGSCDTVVHAAAAIREEVGALVCTQVNALGTAHVLEAAKRWQAQHFIYISGLNVLAHPLEDPITEQHPVGPRTAYGHAKYYSEGLVQLADSPSMGTCALRVSSPVGPGTPNGRIFSNFVRRAVCGEPLVLNGQGSRRQDYVDVRDVGQAVVLAAGARARGTFNIGSGVSVSNEELARHCIETLHSNAAVTFSGLSDPEEAIRWNLSIEHARSVLGYAPAYGLATSIRDYADSCRFD